jgi:hypothetical protein
LQPVRTLILQVPLARVRTARILGAMHVLGLDLKKISSVNLIIDG